MDPNASVRFFDTQFQRQLAGADLQLNPFEQAALPYLRGRVLDYGCGLGNLALAAAQRGCSVVALDASPAAIAHLRQAASAAALPITAGEADLRSYQLHGEFDTVVCIGLLMFFDCATAWTQLRALQAHLVPGGVAVVNVLVVGTTYMDMFDPAGHCLFSPDELAQRFTGWEILHAKSEVFPAPNAQSKSFVTIVARKPSPVDGPA